MTRTISLFLVMGFIISLPFIAPVTGHSTSENLHKETQEAWEAFKSDMADQLHKAVAHGKDLLEKTDAEIDKLEDKASRASGETRSRYNEEVKKLGQKRAKAAEKLDDLENATADRWDATKEGFVNAYRDLYDAYREALEKF